MSKYKLYYLNGRGRAEISRLIFAVAGQKFEDIRYKDNEWPLHKTDMPLGQVPVLEVDGVKLPQSLSISRFLAKQFQLAGKSNFGQAKTDAVVDTINEAFSKFKIAYIEPDEAKKQELIKKFFAEDSPSCLRHLEVLRKSYSNGGPFFVENNLTWADLSVQNALEYFLEANRDCLNDFPWLKQNYEEVRKQPRIAEYLKNRSKEQF